MTLASLGGIVLTRPAGSGRTLVDRLARHIQTQSALISLARNFTIERTDRTYDSKGNSQNHQVNNREGDFLRRLEPLPLVHNQPEDGRETVAKPASKESTLHEEISNEIPDTARLRTYNQTQQVVKHRNRLGDDPGNGPCGQTDRYPSTGGQQTPLVHMVRTLATEDSNVDILACHMAEDHTGNNDLGRC